jgi:hypothetical protein
MTSQNHVWHPPGLLEPSNLDSNYTVNRQLRILHLEDDPDFSELVKSILALDGLAPLACLRIRDGAAINIAARARASNNRNLSIYACEV